MSTAKPPPPRRIRQDLGVHAPPKGQGQFHLELVITEGQLWSLMLKAMGNVDGRATLAGGGIVVLARRVRAASEAR